MGWDWLVVTCMGWGCDMHGVGLAGSDMHVVVVTCMWWDWLVVTCMQGVGPEL